MKPWIPLLALTLAACATNGATGAASDVSAPTPTPIGGSSPTATPAPSPAPCSEKVDVIVWNTQLWTLLGQQLATTANPCAEYYLSIPPTACDAGSTLKLCPRGPDAAQAVRDLGPHFHAMAEFHWSSWSQWVQQTGRTWREAGVEFRARMDAAGYDTSAGDLWEINEFPSSVRTGVGPARVNAENAVRGLDEGPSGAMLVKGTVFPIGMGQGTTNFSVYKPALKSWLADATFWNAMNAHVRFFAQEVYAEPSRTCVASSNVGMRSRRVNEYVEHLASLAAVAPASAAPARAFLKHAYVPLMSAAWNQPPDVGFGDTRVSVTTMKKFVSLETYAARAWSGTHYVPGRRVGFAWAPQNTGALPDATYKGYLADIGTRMGEAIRDGYDVQSGSAAKACAPDGNVAGCACGVAGATFNTGWSGFSSY